MTVSGLELDVDVNPERFVLTKLGDLSVLTPLSVPSSPSMISQRDILFLSPFLWSKMQNARFSILLQIVYDSCLVFVCHVPQEEGKYWNLIFLYFLGGTHTYILGCCPCGHKVVRSPPTAWVCQVCRQACYQGHLMDHLFSHTHTHPSATHATSLYRRRTQPQSLEHKFGSWARSQMLQINFAFFIQTDCVKSYFPLWKVPPNPLDLIPPQRES